MVPINRKEVNMSYNTLMAGDIARALNERVVSGQRSSKRYKGRDIDARRIDNSLPDFLYVRREGNYYYSAETIEWMVFQREIKRTNHSAATYQNFRLIFEAVIAQWGTAQALSEMRACFTEAFPSFLRCLLDKGVELPDDIIEYASPAST